MCVTKTRFVYLQYIVCDYYISSKSFSKKWFEGIVICHLPITSAYINSVA